MTYHETKSDSPNFTDGVDETPKSVHDSQHLVIRQNHLYRSNKVRSARTRHIPAHETTFSLSLPPSVPPSVPPISQWDPRQSKTEQRVLPLQREHIEACCSKIRPYATEAGFSSSFQELQGCQRPWNLHNAFCNPIGSFFTGQQANCTVSRFATGCIAR